MSEAIPKNHRSQPRKARGSETLRTGTKKSMHFTVAEPGQAAKNHGNAAAHQCNGNGGTSAPQEQVMSEKPTPPCGLNSHTRQHCLRLRVRPAKRGPDHWPIGHAVFLHLGQVVRVIVLLTAEHCIAAIITSTGTIRTRDPNVHRCQAAGEGH